MFQHLHILLSSHFGRVFAHMLIPDMWLHILKEKVRQLRDCSPVVDLLDMRVPGIERGEVMVGVVERGRTCSR